MTGHEPTSAPDSRPDPVPRVPALSGPLPGSLRHRLHVIIFEADTPGGRAFDIVLLVAILASVVVVVLESIASSRLEYGGLFRAIEWAFTVIFSIEYALRIFAARRRLRYALSLFGIVDLLSVLPTLLGLFIEAAHSLIVIRALRLLRVFRVFKVARMLGEAQSLLNALRASMPKILVFLGAVLTIVIIVGTLMYAIEGSDSGFTSIPRSMYWAIVTMTTVGYGDIAPETPLGQSVAALLMVMGYGVLAVPTGIVSAELVSGRRQDPELACRACRTRSHLPGSTFCRVCGTALD